MAGRLNKEYSNNGLNNIWHLNIPYTTAYSMLLSLFLYVIDYRTGVKTMSIPDYSFYSYFGFKYYALRQAKRTCELIWPGRVFLTRCCNLHTSILSMYRLYILKGLWSWCICKARLNFNLKINYFFCGRFKLSMAYSFIHCHPIWKEYFNNQNTRVS